MGFAWRLICRKGILECTIGQPQQCGTVCAVSNDLDFFPFFSASSLQRQPNSNSHPTIIVIIIATLLNRYQRLNLVDSLGLYEAPKAGEQDWAIGGEGAAGRSRARSRQGAPKRAEEVTRRNEGSFRGTCSAQELPCSRRPSSRLCDKVKKEESGLRRRRPKTLFRI